MIHVKLDLDPVPWAAPHLSRGRAYDKREADKRAARFLIREQYEGPLLEGPVRLNFIFTFSIPKSYSAKKRKQVLNHELIPTKCDCTNLQKLYEDCLKGIVFKDDRYVEYVSSYKTFGEKSSIEINITGNTSYAT